MPWCLVTRVPRVVRLSYRPPVRKHGRWRLLAKKLSLLGVARVALCRTSCLLVPCMVRRLFPWLPGACRYILVVQGVLALVN